MGDGLQRFGHLSSVLANQFGRSVPMEFFLWNDMCFGELLRN